MPKDASEYLEAPLGDHDRSAFDCGKESLTRFFRERVVQEQERNLCRCYVLVHQDAPNEVLGYYTLSTHSVEAQIAPNKLKGGYEQVNTILIGRLAVHQPGVNRGLGHILLGMALLRCLEVSKRIGARAVVVDALDDEAEVWYQKQGFLPLKADKKLYMMIKTMEQALR